MSEKDFEALRQQYSDQMRHHIARCARCRALGGGGNALDCMRGVIIAEEAAKNGVTYMSPAPPGDAAP